MANGEFHLGPDGPARCRAENDNCPYKDDGHYATVEAAGEKFEQKMGGTIPASISSENSARTISLSSNMGTFDVVDGNLDDPRARTALSSGLCGDLALAIHRETGGAPYFLSYHFSSDQELADAFQAEPNAVIAGSVHVLIESPTKPNHFVDSYGQQDFDSLEDTYDDAVLIEGTIEMLEHFADSAGADKLSQFAQSAIELDGKGIRYENDLDEWDDDEDE